jgi:hypothetical protein
MSSFIVTEPGVYEDMPEDVYHGDPVPEGSLSSSGARKLLPPSCPAIFRHEQLNGRPPKRTFDFGHAAHAKVLGIGAEVVPVDADDWRTKAAREARDEAHASGRVPLLVAECEQVDAMAEAIQQHPVASALFDAARGGKPEQSIFWRDERHEVWRRARLDWLPAVNDDGRLIVADYKTCVSAEPAAISKAVANYGYHQQADWYSEAVMTAGIAEQVAFVFVFQEKTAPYVITVVELNTEAMFLGRQLNERALRIYRQCRDTDRWPGYSDDVELVSLPVWAEIQQKELIS